ncbi:MAG TPA: riboflavin biosynthesis protein RibF [Candidatus Limnocylindria bacterium]|nr:riboflavin biosynthesis protein RibF [Candidatus Limnocylindria bacterium]
MSVLRDLVGWPAGPLHLALGVFDGVHVGHRALLEQLVRGARSEDARAIAATFDPLPEVGLGQQHAVACALTTIAERERLLHAAGADDVAVFTFDDAFSRQSADAFVEGLCGAGRIRRVLVGQGFRFGFGREGDEARLEAEGRARGFEVGILDPVTVDGAIVSSTRIRDALRAGDLAAAGRLLGREYSADGTVARGEQRGRGLGYPTINVETPAEKILPRDGIYACWVEVGGARHAAATSLGVRPTFGPGPRTFECHLLDFTGDLYGAQVRVTFVRRLRDEQRFPTPAALSAQIARDVEETRATLRR